MRNINIASHSWVTFSLMRQVREEGLFLPLQKLTSGKQRGEYFFSLFFSFSANLLAFQNIRRFGLEKVQLSRHNAQSIFISCKNEGREKEANLTPMGVQGERREPKLWQEGWGGEWKRRKNEREMGINFPESLRRKRKRIEAGRGERELEKKFSEKSERWCGNVKIC